MPFPPKSRATSSAVSVQSPAWSRALLAAAAIVAVHKAESASPPEIERISPSTLRPGRAVVLTLRGKALEGMRGIWTSWSGTVPRNDAEGWEASSGSARVPIQVPDSFPCGIEAIRILGTNGISNTLLIPVDFLTTVDAHQENTSISRAAAMPFPGAAVGTCEETSFRYHKISLKRGQRAGIEIVAERLGSNADPVVRVLDASRKVVAECGDTPGLGADCGLLFEAPADGDYFIEVRDSEYLGGSGFFYRLRAGEFPVAVLPEAPVAAFRAGSQSTADSLPWNSGVQGERGGSQTATFVHSQLPTNRLEDADSSSSCAARPTSESPAARDEERDTKESHGESEPGPAAVQRFRVNGTFGSQAWTPRLEQSPHLPESESEPNDAGQETGPRPIVGGIAGNFGAPGDVDRFRFHAETAGWWRFEARSRLLGQAADPVLRIVGADGKAVTPPVLGDPDPVLFHQANSNSTFSISVTEAAGRSGPGRGYWLQVQRGVGPVLISTENERIHVPREGSVSLKLKIENRGYDGPLRLEAANLPAGVTLENPRIDAKKKEWDLKLRCDATGRLGDVQEICLRAFASDSGNENVSEVRIAPALRKQFPGMLAVAPTVPRRLWIGVIAPEPKSPPAASP